MESTAKIHIQSLLNEKLIALEKHFDADVFCYYGVFQDRYNNALLKVIEELASDENKKDKIYVVLTSTGGSAHVVERYVNILRHHYKEVNFIVPDYAYSAGTIFCMSGDNILMDYFSVLGPIDPQVPNKDGVFVAALGYLDKVNELIKKAQNGKLSDAEFIILKEFDLAQLRGYEQARDLTLDLLQKWLVKYKFKNWNKHRNNPKLLNKRVTNQEKEKRARKIAKNLSDNNKWQAHGRPINIETLKEIGLEIDDYSANKERRTIIREYHDLLIDSFGNNSEVFVHTRKHI